MDREVKSDLIVLEDQRERSRVGDVGLRAGDFHRFYDDPRTRVNYLKWAPFLQRAENWCAGKRGGSR